MARFLQPVGHLKHFRDSLRRAALLRGRPCAAGLRGMLEGRRPPGRRTPARRPLPKVRFKTDWYPQAEHGGFYQALAKGYYRDAGHRRGHRSGRARSPRAPDSSLAGQVGHRDGPQRRHDRLGLQGTALRDRRRLHGARPAGHPRPRREPGEDLCRPEQPHDHGRSRARTGSTTSRSTTTSTST